MSDHVGKPMSIGTIFVVIILSGIVAGALLGILRAEFGGPVWLPGALAGAIVGGLAQLLFRRRTRALEHDR